MALKTLDAARERRAIVALVAVFVLLVQAVIPSLAMASPPVSGLDTICSATGVQGGHGPAPGQHMPGGACDHCVCPVALGMDASAAGMVREPVRYPSHVEAPGLGAETCSPGRGLAAPPPPSRGPPA